MSNVLKMLSRGGAVAAETDPNFKQTTLLLHGDGTNGAQNNTFLDGSTNNFTITRNGNTTQGTFSPFSVGAGQWSNFFDGSTGYLTVANNTALQVSDQAFTIEGWFYLGNPPSSGNFKTLWAYRSSVAGFGGALCVYQPDGGLYFYIANSTASNWGNSGVAANLTVTPNAWQHIAMVRSGNTFTIFLNGVAGTGTVTQSGVVGQSGNFSIMAGSSSGGQLVDGYVSNFRLVKGTALYTSNFTPPTTPLTAITNTSLLTCQSNRFVDNSTNAFAITRNGDVRVTPFSPFAPTAAYSAATNGGSGYFDGTGDYLTAPDNAAFDYGNGAFTVELWVYLNASTSGTNIPFIFQGSSAFSTDSSWAFLRHSSDKLRFISTPDGGTTFTITDSTASFLPTTSQWYHLAAVRSGSTVTLYVNGVSVGSGTNSTTFFNSTRNVAIGASSDGAAVINGYISGVKIIKGTASAPSGVPTTPPVDSSGTSLLLNFTNAGIIDNTAKNVLETVGNAQIETSIVKYGTGALEFDGSGDYLKIPSSVELTMGSGDWTVEFWLNLNATGTQVIVDNRTDAFSANKIYIAYVSNSLNYYTANANPAITGGSLATTTWYHIAVSRSSGSTRLFINGTQAGSTYSDSQTYNTSNFGIGAVAIDGTFGLNGYIDDLRITKGIARYTANFTAPTKEFPDQ